MKHQGTNINSVEKALKILLSFSAEHPVWGVRELATFLDFSPATVQRLFNNLKAYDFIAQDPESRQYRLGYVYFRFLQTLQSTYPFTQTALIFMQRLLDRTQETVHLNVIENMERVCIENLESPQHLKATMSVGSRSPLYAGASSKCLLAFSSQKLMDAFFRRAKLKRITKNTVTDVRALRAELKTIRENGYAASLGERNPGLGSLSAPVMNHKGVLLASISLAIPEIRYKEDRYRKLCIKALIETANAFSKAMGFHDLHQTRVLGSISAKR